MHPRTYGAQGVVWDVNLAAIIRRFPLYEEAALASFFGGTEVEDDIRDSGMLDLDNLTDELLKCAMNLETSHFNEYTYGVLEILIGIYRAQNNLDKLNIAHGLLRDCVSAMKNSNINTRVLMNYYLVGLYGDVFGEDENGVQYIVRVYRKQSVGDFQQEIIKKIQDSFSSGF